MADKLERLEEQSKKIPEARQRHALGDALDTAVHEARGATNAITRLEQLSPFVPLVRNQLTSTERDQLGRWILSLQAIGNRLALATDTGELATAADGLKRDLTPAVTQVAELISNGWRARIDHAFSATGRLGVVLREIPETNQLGSDMEALARRAEQLAATIEDAEQNTEQFRALTNERDRTKVMLADLGAGEEVVHFLLAVAERSANLANVTAEVRAWLDARDALECFKVGL
jgi:hypothetical protein